VGGDRARGLAHEINETVGRLTLIAPTTSLPTNTGAPMQATPTSVSFASIA
jgi:hypothetical protein